MPLPDPLVGPSHATGPNLPPRAQKFRDGIEKSRQTVAANYKDGTSQALKRGELGGLSFTGFYSTGDTGSRENRFEYERRRYASDKDVEFLPGAATYG